jgi:signal transduction histidine kinase
MSDLINNLGNWFIPVQFMPHGHCYLWDPWILRQNVISNALIGIAYYCIPIALVYFVKKRKDLQFNWIFFMFSLFIFACGTTHFVNILTIWRPAYRLDAGLMSLTAVFSVATLIMLIKLMPQLLKLPSPSMLQDHIKQLEQEVSLRIRAEAELKALNLQLDQKVSQRTQELTTVNQELSSAKKVLEMNIVELTQANNELNNFAYASSHDLKSPLRGIDQLATWVAEDLGEKISANTQQHLQLMRSRIKRMEILLDDLLAYSRVGRTETDIVEVKTRNLIEDIFDITAPNKPIKLILADNLPTLKTQKAPLELVFRNLISNAIKHHDKAQGTITISSEPTENGIEFTVKDDGPGIPLEHQERVFKMFQTLKPRDQIEGSGIGLAIVKKAVESVGGKISLESNGQQGCTFRFTWPLIPTKYVSH